MLPQSAGEGAVLTFTTDPEVGGPQPGTGASIFTAVDEVDARGLAGDVLGNVGNRPSDRAGVAGHVGAVLAQSTVGPAPTLVESRGAWPQAAPLGQRHLGSEYEISDVFVLV